MLFLIKNVIFDANIMQNLYKTKQTVLQKSQIK